jgi:hypothetical protein
MCRVHPLHAVSDPKSELCKLALPEEQLIGHIIKLKEFRVCKECLVGEEEVQCHLDQGWLGRDKKCRGWRAKVKRKAPDISDSERTRSPNLAESPLCDDHTDDGEQNGEDHCSCPVDISEKSICYNCPEQAAEYADDASFTPDRLMHDGIFHWCIYIGSIH